MTAKRPSLKRPGVTLTGRQWAVVEAIREDGWLVLEADPARWTPPEVARIYAALAQRRQARRVSYLVGSPRASLEASLAEYRANGFGLGALGADLLVVADDIEAHLAWLDSEAAAGRVSQ